MKIAILSIFCLCLSLGMTSCKLDDNLQEFETTVTVVDMNNHPLKDRQVNVLVRTSQFFGSFANDEQTHAVAVTDASGQAVLRYKLNLTDDLRQFATAAVQEDDVYKALNVVTQQAFTSKGQVIKNAGTIQMDSFVTFTMRFKTERTDVQGISLTIGSESIFNFTQNSPLIRRTFVGSFTPTRTAKLDTVMTTKVFSKAPFALSSTMSFLTTPFSISKGVVKYNQNSDRSGVLFQTF